MNDLSNKYRYLRNLTLTKQTPDLKEFMSEIIDFKYISIVFSFAFYFVLAPQNAKASTCSINAQIPHHQKCSLEKVISNHSENQKNLFHSENDLPSIVSAHEIKAPNLFRVFIQNKSISYFGAKDFYFRSGLSPPVCFFV